MDLRHRGTGFTLIELMIVVVIVAVLAAITFPSYQRYVLDSWRSKAAACLSETANAMERRFTATMSYAGDLPELGCIDEGNMPDRYDFELTAVAANTFTLRAAPEGPQLKDAQCLALTLNQAGVRGCTATGCDPVDCW